MKKLTKIKCLIFGVILLLMVLLVSLMPVQRIEWKTSVDEIRISPDNDKKALAVSVLTKTSDPSQMPSIDVNRSYAVSPSGERFGLRVQNNEFADGYAKNHPTPWILKELYLNEPSAKNDVDWENGNWELNLFFSGPTARPPIHSEFRLYAFWYCPFFMRPF
jgi:hypothetical protein